MNRTTRLWGAALLAAAACVLSLALRTPAAPAAALQPAPGLAPGEAAVVADATLGIGSAEVEAGATVTVPLTTTLGTYTLGAVTVHIRYDPAVVEATACAADPDDLFVLALCNVHYADDTVAFTAISVAGVTGSLTLAAVTFLAVGDAGQASLLELEPISFDDPSGQPIPVGVENGTIHVTGAPLPAPSGLAASGVSGSEIDLTWEDNSSDETAFYVERSPDGNADWSEIATVASGVTAYQDSGLACGTAHYYRVRAYRAGDGVYSNYSNVAGDSTDACEGATLGIGLVEVEAGAAVTVPLTTTLGVYTLGAVTVHIQYDPAVVEAVGCTADPAGLFDQASCDDGYTPDTVAFTATSAAGVTGSPTLAKVAFRAVGDPGQGSLLHLTPVDYADPAGTPISVVVKDGQISIRLPVWTLYLPLLLKAYP